MAAAAPSADSIRAATLRLMSDLKAITADCPPGVSASPLSESDLFTWVASIVGPDESPFEGGIFQLRIQFPDQYPEKPPRVRFITEVGLPLLDEQHAAAAWCEGLPRHLVRCALSPMLTADVSPQLVSGRDALFRHSSGEGHVCHYKRLRLPAVILADRKGSVQSCSGCASFALTPPRGSPCIPPQEPTACKLPLSVSQPRIAPLQDKWKPIYTVGSILTSIQSLLTDPNLASPANPEAARLLATNPKEYKRRVRRLAEKSVESA